MNFLSGFFMVFFWFFFPVFFVWFFIFSCRYRNSNNNRNKFRGHNFNTCPAVAVPRSIPSRRPGTQKQVLPQIYRKLRFNRMDLRSERLRAWRAFRNSRNRTCRPLNQRLCPRCLRYYPQLRAVKYRNSKTRNRKPTWLLQPVTVILLLVKNWLNG